MFSTGERAFSDKIRNKFVGPRCITFFEINRLHVHIHTSEVIADGRVASWDGLSFGSTDNLILCARTVFHYHLFPRSCSVTKGERGKAKKLNSKIYETRTPACHFRLRSIFYLRKMQTSSMKQVYFQRREEGKKLSQDCQDLATRNKMERFNNICLENCSSL